MPLALIVIGAILLLVAVRNTHSELGSLLVEDFTGSEGAVGFFVWIGAIAFIGALGWVPGMKTPSRILLAIVIFGIIGSNTGAWQKIKDSIVNPPAAAPAKKDETAALPDAFPVAVAGGGGDKASGAAGAIGSLAKAVPVIGGFFG